MILIFDRAKVNAISSPLLRLPAEVRSLIFDQMFENLIRIRPSKVVDSENTSRNHYRLSGCKCPPDDKQHSPRIWSYLRQRNAGKNFKQGCKDCEARVYKAPGLAKFSLHTLLVCRQIHHEAALKPFSQAIFIYEPETTSARSDSGLQAFLRALIPAQAKAITHLQLTGPVRDVLSSGILPQLKGLRHLRLSQSHWFDTAIKVFYFLRYLKNMLESEGVPKLGLRSLHFEIGLQLHVGVDGEVEKPTLSEAERLEDVMKRMELELLGKQG